MEVAGALCGKTYLGQCSWNNGQHVRLLTSKLLVRTPMHLFILTRTCRPAPEILKDLPVERMSCAAHCCNSLKQADYRDYGPI